MLGFRKINVQYFYQVNGVVIQLVIVLGIIVKWFWNYYFIENVNIGFLEDFQFCLQGKREIFEFLVILWVSLGYFV